MAIVRWRPFDEMFTLRREMDRLFDRVFTEDLPEAREGWGSWNPPLNVSETGSSIIISAEVPGLDSKDLEITINDTDCDAVVIGTPNDLNRIINIKKPSTRVFYDLQEIGHPNLDEVLEKFISEHRLG